LIKNGITVLPQPPYSPDLAPAEYYLLPRMKTLFKGNSFQLAKEMNEKYLKRLKEKVCKSTFCSGVVTGINM
jgi:transposase